MMKVIQTLSLVVFAGATNVTFATHPFLASVRSELARMTCSEIFKPSRRHSMIPSREIQGALERWIEAWTTHHPTHLLRPEIELEFLRVKELTPTDSSWEDVTLVFQYRTLRSLRGEERVRLLLHYNLDGSLSYSRAPDLDARDRRDLTLFLEEALEELEEDFLRFVRERLVAREILVSPKHIQYARHFLYEITTERPFLARDVRVTQNQLTVYLTTRPTPSNRPLNADQIIALQAHSAVLSVLSEFPLEGIFALQNFAQSPLRIMQSRARGPSSTNTLENIQSYLLETFNALLEHAMDQARVAIRNRERMTRRVLAILQAPRFQRDPELFLSELQSIEGRSASQKIRVIRRLLATFENDWESLVEFHNATFPELNPELIAPPLPPTDA